MRTIPPTMIYFLVAVGAAIAIVVDIGFVPLTKVLRTEESWVWLGFLSLGVIGAQGALHAVWCVLAPVPLRRRTAVAVAAGLVTYHAWAIGYTVQACLSPPPDSEYVYGLLRGIQCLPVILLVVQVPLWVARIWLDWRIEYDGAATPPASSTKLGIRHLLMCTATVAFALAAARLCASVTEVSANDFLLGLGGAAAIAAVVSLLTVVPILLAVLRAKRWAFYLLLTTLLYAGLALSFLLIGSAIAGEVAPPGAYVAFATLIGAFVLFLGGGLLAARGLGYRLVGGSRQKT